MTEPDPEDRSRPNSEDDETVLRAKYLDYCSARVAELLLHLSPDETYLLAEKAARSRGEEPASSYMEIVEAATQWLAGRVTLPPFEEWVEDYRANPEQYESDLLGLWRSDSGDEDPESGTE